MKIVKLEILKLKVLNVFMECVGAVCFNRLNLYGIIIIVYNEPTSNGGLSIWIWEVLTGTVQDKQWAEVLFSLDRLQMILKQILGIGNY